MHYYSGPSLLESKSDLKFADTTLLEEGGDPGGKNHVAANGEWSVHQEIDPVGIVGAFLQNVKKTLNPEIPPG